MKKKKLPAITSSVSVVRKQDLVYRSIFHTDPTYKKYNVGVNYECFVCKKALIVATKSRVKKEYIFSLNEYEYGLAHPSCYEVYKVVPYV